MPEKEVLVIAGGRSPDPSWFRKMAKERTVWAVDAGADCCKKASVLPDLAIGDFDGIDPSTFAWLEENGVTINRHPREKDKTDIQLCLEHCLQNTPPVFAIITGCWGGRFDHAWSLVNSVWRTNQEGGFSRLMTDRTETLILIKGGEEISLEVGERGDLPPIVSLFALSERAEGVGISGVRWPLKWETLQRSYPYSISNSPIGKENPVSIRLDRGWLGIYLAGRSAELKKG